MANSSSNIIVDIEYIHQVVYDLTLNELQHILGAVNQGQFGSIQLLRKRILSLLTDPTHKIKNLKQKILQVFNTRLQPSQQLQQPTRQFLREPQNNLQIHSQSYTAPTTSSIQPLVETPSSIQTFVETPSSIQPFVATSSSIQPFVETPSPAIQFEPLPFFKTVQALLKPTHCQTNIDSANLTGIFHLTENVNHAIVNSLNTARQEYKIQIILRFLRLGLNENVTDRLPYNIRVSVNDHECKLPELNIPTIRGINAWRSNVPIDITQQTILRTSVQNTIRITWSKEEHKFMAGVYVAHRLTSNDLLEELKKRPVRASDKTKEIIKKSMKNDADMGVESMFTTVKDPLTKLRMKLPARGVDCIHLQCFDAIQFLQMNEQKEKWVCPLCNKKVKFENIEVDEFFLKMLQSPVLSKECENVLLLKDGTWSDVKNKGFSNNSRINKSGSKKNIEVLTLSDSDDDNDEIIPKPKHFKNNPSKVGESEHGIEIDLTNPSESDEPFNGRRSRPLIPLIESTSMSNNAYLPNISISGSNNCVAGSSGSSRNNGHQGKDNSRKVLCVITLD